MTGKDWKNTSNRSVITNPLDYLFVLADSENSQVGTSQDRSSSYVIHSFLSSNSCPDSATRNSCCPYDNVRPFRLRINSFQKIEVLFKRMKNRPSSSTRQRHYYRRCFWLETIRTWGHLVRLASDTARLLHPPTFIASHFLY